MADLDSRQSLKILNFTLVDFWIHFLNLNLPSRFDIEDIAKQLTSLMGTNVAIGPEHLIKQDGPLLHVRASIDIEQPLMTRVHLQQEDYPNETIDVQYEALPLFYFYCGRIGHALKECKYVQRKK